MELAKTQKEQIPPRVPKGAWAWATFLYTKPQAFFLQYAGVDAYLFTRYIGIFAGISLIGCIILLPILLPVNATNGQNLSGFDLLAYSNVTPSGSNKQRYFAHAFLSWAFFGLIVFVIYKELVYYVSLRHSLQTTPMYDGLLSSRTLMLWDIPDKYDDVESVKSIFPLAQRIWFARDYKELTKLVKERTKLSNKYEGTLNKVIQKAVKYQKKLVKKGEKLPEEPQGYIQKEPTHKLGKIPFIGKKVNTIDYSIDRLGELNTEISEVQATPETGKQAPAVFIEFPNQLEAQRAYQAVPFASFKQRAIGVSPEDVVWSTLAYNKTQRLIRTILANTFLTLLIIFWAIPVAVVGCISNITFLTEKVPFLKFINNCPKVILGLITAILPTVALAILMSLVPVIIKAVGKQSGLTTRQQIENYCQSWYFGFQVVQVFLVVTLASSASSTVTAIIDEPDSAMTLLSQNLPKASNFYIAFFLMQGLMTPAKSLLQAVPLILSKVLGFLQNTPRKKWTKFNTLSTPQWGVVYPPIELLVVLFVVYAIISPILLIFSTFALALMYMAYLYLTTYVYGHPTIDMRGRNYPKALFQTFVGLYLAEICCLGLFIMSKSWGPVVLEAVMLVVTVLAHLYYRYKFERLFDAVPITAIQEARGDGNLYPSDMGNKEIKETGKNYWTENSDGSYTVTREKTDPAADSNSSKNETVVGAPDGPSKDLTQDDVNKTTDINTLEKQAKKSPGLVLKRFFSPKDGYNFSLIRSQLPAYFNLSTSYTSEFLDTAYNDPVISDEEPHIWIPRDPLGVSQYEIAKTEGKVDVSDINTTFDDKGKFDVTGPPPAYDGEVQI